MRTTVVDDTTPLVEETLTGTADRPLGVVSVLRLFDLLRRRLARQVGGSDGFTIGYDLLQIDRLALAALDTDTIHVTAALVGARTHGHQVEYRAWAPGSSPGTDVPLILARGWTQVPPDHRKRRGR